MNVNEIASLGSNVKPVIQNENCAVLMLNDATGEGVMTVYRVMPGVMICFSDMHMEQCASEFELKNNRKIFCIDHCREGRIEREVKPGVFSIMQENELRLDNRENHKGTTYYPLKLKSNGILTIFFQNRDNLSRTKMTYQKIIKVLGLPDGSVR